MSVCKQCGGEVRWRLENGESGRWRCFNPDGSEHWSWCAKLRMDQVRATGVRFDTPNESGYRNSVHGTKLVRQTNGFEKSDHVFVTHTCGLPAWEECECK